MTVPETEEEFYENAPCGYVSFREDDGRIERLNRTLARWLGYTPDELVGVRRFQDLLSAPGRMVHETRHMPQLRSGGTAGALALEMARSDRKRMPVLVTSRMRSGEGIPSVVRTTIFDATSHRHYELELIRARDRAEQATLDARAAWEVADAANQAKSRFLAAMNHEFRTPIGIIGGFAEVLTGDGALSDEARADFLGEIRSAALHLADLLKDATRYAGLDELERAPRLRPVRLRGTVTDGVRLAQSAMQARGIEVSIRALADDVETIANGAAVSEALACLLRDIAQRAAPGAALTIDIGADTGRATIVLGGPAVVQAEPAVRGLLASRGTHDVLHRGLEGSGLGVAFAERVLGLCGGRLTLSGAGEDVGIVLTFAPISVTAAAPAREQSTATHSPRP